MSLSFNEKAWLAQQYNSPRAKEERRRAEERRAEEQKAEQEFKRADARMAAELANIMKADGRVIEGGYTPKKEDWEFARSHFEEHSLVDAKKCTLLYVCKTLAEAGIDPHRSAEHARKQGQGMLFLFVCVVISIIIITAAL